MPKEWQAHCIYLMLAVEQQICCHDVSMLDLAGWCRCAAGGIDPAAAAAVVLGELQEKQRESEDGCSRAVELQKRLLLISTKDSGLSQGHYSCLRGICPSRRIPAYSFDRKELHEELELRKLLSCANFRKPSPQRR